MNLCRNCESFNIQSWAEKNESQKRLIPCFSIVDGANSGCSFCSFLIEAFLTAFPAETKEIKLGTFVKFTPIRTAQPTDGLGITAFLVELNHDDEKKEAFLRLSVTAEDGKWIIFQENC